MTTKSVSINAFFVVFSEFSLIDCIVGLTEPLLLLFLVREGKAFYAKQDGVRSRYGESDREKGT